MARQVLPIVGAVVGAYFGNPQLGYAIGSIIGNAVDPQVIEGPALGEGQVNTAREGGYRPIVLGTGCVGCNIINVGPEKIRTHRERQSKGGGPVSETKRRYRTFALRICEGPIAGLLRIWQGEKLVYDVRPESVIPEDSAKYAEGFTFYLGDETQLPDPDLEAYLGAGNVNAYRGTAYIVFTNFDLTDTQGAIPNFRFEVTSAATVESQALVYLAGVDIPSSSVRISEDGDQFPVIEDTGLGAEIVRLHQAGGAVYAFANSSSARVKLPGSSEWSTVTGLPGGVAQANSMAYADGVWIIVYSSGNVISRSEDGVNFASVSVTNRSRYGSAGIGDTFVVGSTQGFISVSVDRGLSWFNYVPNDETSITDSVVSVAAADTNFVLGINTQHPILTSPSGVPDSWTEFEHPFSSLLNTPIILGYHSGVLVLRASVDTARSINGGASWSIGDDLPFSPNTQFRIHSNINGFYVGAGGAASGSVARSIGDGTWTPSSYDDNSVLVVATDPASLPVTAGDPIPLASIISFVHQRCGHESSTYDVSELTDLVDGVVFADSYTGSDAIRTIIPIYFADAAEHDAGSGYKINYIKRGKPVVRTLVLDDLVDEPQEATRLDSLERAAKFHLHFQNPTIGYAAAKATSSRSSPDVTSNVTGEISVQVPITFADVNEAAQRSNVLHKVSWVEVAGTQEIMVSDADMDLVPTDVIGLYLRGILTRYRMVTQEYIDGTLKCEFMADRQSAYTSNVTGIPLPEPEPPPSSIVGPTISVFGDWPALVDGHDALIAYAAATGQTSAWWGATYQRSLDDGATYTTAATFDDFNTIMGVLQETLPDASEHYTDTTNSVRVTLYTEDQIEALTQQQFLSEGGGFALSWETSEGTKWEMLQYRDVEQDSNGDWILSHLLRGRLDTETAEHPPGAIFVLLDNSLKIMPMQSAWLGMELTHRAYSNGETPESAVPYEDEFTGQSQREWPVANLLLERDGDDIEATAIPRHRFGTDDAPVQSVNHSGYRWTATDGVNTVNIDTVVPTQTFDATGWATPVTVTVAQLNRITGAGPSVSEEIA